MTLLPGALMLILNIDKPNIIMKSWPESFKSWKSIQISSLRNIIHVFDLAKPKAKYWQSLEFTWTLQIIALLHAISWAPGLHFFNLSCWRWRCGHIKQQGGLFQRWTMLWDMGQVACSVFFISIWTTSAPPAAPAKREMIESPGISM